MAWETGILIVAEGKIILSLIRYGATWILYYLILLIYVIKIKGKVFDIPGFELFFIVPFIPEIIIYEVKEYRGK